ncbi:MAG: hypothetical protein ACLF0G_04035 [Candidatus Brocadiia bacterium]
MKETIQRFRDLLVARLGVLEEEIRLAEARYKEQEGDFHYVTLENTAIVERQLHDLHRLRERLRTMDIEAFDSIEQFRQFVLTQLQQLYDARAIMRPSIRMVMECVRDLVQPT